jgi:hypothetical protein
LATRRDGNSTSGKEAELRRAVLLCALVIGAQSAGMSGTEGAGAQLPPIDVPDLPAPELPVPELPAPELPPPPLPAPELPAPPLPAPELPSVTTPSAPAASSTPAPTPSSAPSSGPSSAPAAPSRGSAPEQSRSSAAPGGSAALPYRRSAARRSSGATRGRRATEPSFERRLRRTVRRLASCLDELPSRQRRVLVLRAGVGPRDPISRRRVARRLDLPVRRVARIERRGMRRLLSLGRCGAAPNTSEPGAATAAASGPPAHPLATRAVAGGDGPAASAAEPGSGVEGTFDTSKDDSRPPTFVPPLGQDEAADLSLVLVLLGAALLGYALQRELRSGRRTT